MNMNDVFFWCVDALKNEADRLGMTYEELNVWLFLIIMPSVIIFLTIYSLFITFRYLNLKTSASKFNKNLH